MPDRGRGPGSPRGGGPLNPPTLSTLNHRLSVWLDSKQTRKWRSDSLESRIYAAAEAEALAAGHSEQEAAFAALEAVFQTMGWLYGQPYAVVVVMVKDEFGVDTSIAALNGFWSRFSAPYLSERMRRSSAAAAALKGELSTEGVEAAASELLSQKLFEMLTSPSVDPSDVVRLHKEMIRARQTRLDERKVALLEEKARKADAAQDVMESQIPEEEKAARMRSIFGMG